MTLLNCPDCGMEIDVSNRISGDIIFCPSCDAQLIIRFTPVIITIEEPNDAE
jgi:hypothetical protein